LNQQSLEYSNNQPVDLVACMGLSRGIATK